MALHACHSCSVDELALLRGELAGYLVLGGFPEAAAPLWRQTLRELPERSASRPAASLGLGVALPATGRDAEAARAWSLACREPLADAQEDAACRFNVAVARMDSQLVWSEMEQLLPTLLSAPGPLSRATALLQTARAASRADKSDRALQLLEQAESLIVRDLDPGHPFRATVYAIRAEVAEHTGDSKQARLWRKKANKSPDRGGWSRGTVSLDELKRRR